MKVPFLDLKAQYSTVKSEIDNAISNVMESQHFVLGPWVQACETAIAEYSKCSFAVGVSSGTDALLICLMAEGIGRGDEVITTPYTFFATAGVIARVGARPVFVDIDPVTYNLNPEQIASKITTKTRAIIPVHLYGQMADMDAVMSVAHGHQLVVIEDAAQAIGAEYKGRRAGSIGHYGCLSYFPSKNLGAAGDGGMVLTNDSHRAENLMCLRAHGSKPKYFHKMIGGNFRLDSLQAAIVLAKLPYLDGWTLARQRNAGLYNRLFEDSGLRVADTAQYGRINSSPGEAFPKDRWTDRDIQLFLPKVLTDRHIYNQYVIRVSHRDKLRSALQDKGVSTEVYYPVPMHLQDCFSYLEYPEGAFPESEKAAKETLALPIYPELTEEQIRHVARCVREFFSAES
jgi:dTDP-4-amino-4,6-dideoxygalactose transaminase